MTVTKKTIDAMKSIPWFKYTIKRLPSIKRRNLNVLYTNAMYHYGPSSPPIKLIKMEMKRRILPGQSSIAHTILHNIDKLLDHIKTNHYESYLIEMMKECKKENDHLFLSACCEAIRIIEELYKHEEREYEGYWKEESSKSSVIIDLPSHHLRLDVQDQRNEEKEGDLVIQPTTNQINDDNDEVLLIKRPENNQSSLKRKQDERCIDIVTPREYPMVIETSKQTFESSDSCNPRHKKQCISSESPTNTLSVSIDPNNQPNTFHQTYSIATEIYHCIGLLRQYVLQTVMKGLVNVWDNPQQCAKYLDQFTLRILPNTLHHLLWVWKANVCHQQKRCQIINKSISYQPIMIKINDQEDLLVQIFQSLDQVFIVMNHNVDEKEIEYMIENDLIAFIKVYGKTCDWIMKTICERIEANLKVWTGHAMKNVMVNKPVKE